MAKARRTVSKATRQAARKKVRQDKKERSVNAAAVPVEFKPRTKSQSEALKLIERNDISFLIGSAGSGKTFLAMAYAITQILDGKKTKIVLTRPIVEAGERLGFLPGTFGEKVNPYMQPLYDAMDALLGKYTAARDLVNKSVVLAPLCYMRGRAQPLDAKILTPDGYREMGAIKVNDEVIGADGLPTRVLGVYPQGEMDVYRISFSDGTSVECSEDHLWQTATLNEQRTKQKHSVKTTLQIKNTLKNKYGQKIHRLPITAPVHFTPIDALPIDPYTLGALLGDGNFHGTTNITLTNIDKELVSRVSVGAAPQLELVGVKARAGFSPQYRVVGSKRGDNYLRSQLRILGLRGKSSPQKFIPEIYLRASIQNRIELLRGLMDTDGSVFKHRSGNSRVQYYSTSKRLADDVRFLVHSLGGAASLRKREYANKTTHIYRGREIVHRHPMYVLDIVMGDINPFYISRKAKKWKPAKPQRIICNVELVAKKLCQCIRVAAADSLYLTEHCIVTHNTFQDSICIFDEAQNATYTQLKLFLSRFGENSKVIVTGDPDQSDLYEKHVHNYCALTEVYEKLAKIEGIDVIKFANTDVVRHPLVGKILDEL